jgi:hypothetical protein
VLFKDPSRGFATFFSFVGGMGNQLPPPPRPQFPQLGILNLNNNTTLDSVKTFYRFGYTFGT